MLVQVPPSLRRVPLKVHILILISASARVHLMLGQCAQGSEPAYSAMPSATREGIHCIKFFGSNKRCSQMGSPACKPH